MKKHNQQGGNLAFALGALIGTGIGAGLAFWFSPQSGAQTRHELQKRTEELRAQARERIEGPSADQLLSEAKAAAHEYRNA